MTFGLYALEWRCETVQSPLDTHKACCISGRLCCGAYEEAKPHLIYTEAYFTGPRHSENQILTATRGTLPPSLLRVHVFHLRLGQL